MIDKQLHLEKISPLMCLRALLLLVVLAGQAYATSPDVSVSTSSMDNTTPQSISFAKLPTSQSEIVVVAENAKVQVKHVPGLKEINISANCPGNWNINQNTIRQAGFSQGKAGVAMKADALGSRAIVKGKVYLLPTGQIKGLRMGSDGVFVGGEQIQPLSGSSVAGSSTGFDELQIQIPANYHGGLKIGASGVSEINVDSWNGGEISCTLTEKSSLFADKLDSLQKAIVDNRGNGKAEISHLSTKVFVANTTGNGSVVVSNGTAEVSNATVEGSGSITLKGKYKNLKKSVEGTGTIEINQ